jgi:hypothetical protein
MSITTIDKPAATTDKPTFTIGKPAMTIVEAAQAATIVDAMAKYMKAHEKQMKTRGEPIRQRRPMDPDIKQEWCTRLRSGRYPQSIGHLQDRNGYCCLGVLSEIAHEQGVVSRVILNVQSQVYYYDGECNFLSQDVARWAGLTSHDPNVMGFGHLISLAVLNDNHVPFSTIADLIEEQL